MAITPAQEAAALDSPYGAAGAARVEVVRPLGMSPEAQKGMAPAPVRRAGLRVALVSNGKVNGSELLFAVARLLGESLPDLEVRHYRKPSVSVPATDEDIAEIAATADAVVAAIGDCGSCSSRTIRDAIDFEALGIPSVAIIADALISPVDYMRRLSGMPDYPFAVTKFPVGNLTAAETDERAAALAPEIERLLFTGRPARADDGTAPLTTAHAEDETPNPETFGSADAALAEFHRRGWTDGLPVVVPTRARVAHMLDTVGLSADHVVFRVPTRNDLTVTAEVVAANAVMAGALPEYFPVVLAAARALGRPEYNLHGHTATLSGAQQIVIVHGPVRDRIGLNSGEGALGPGTRANATIGRALRLLVRNGCRSVHGKFDRSTFGHPGRYSWCFGEAEDDSPWTPLTTEMGLPAGTEAVSLYASVWQSSVICHSRDAEVLLGELGLAARTACHVNWLHRDVATDSSFYAGRPFLFVVGHEHAAVLSAGGYTSKDAIRTALYARLTEPHETLRAAAVASPEQLRLVYVHATGMQQSWFFAPFQSHHLVTEPVGDQRQPATEGKPR
ncbi:hypothetical protein KZZ52_42905 [Dactylosporangium sp. AC04546]|uniref:UGSC family (seleno)protein n=1 Tax=Dactylosporangium sp. AC04546 TaxID=2862460 RepID=UPI001EDFDDB4|nr:hypothetical protein [Dactylosporangium sp. AC04546]WVK80664.1 hypothetical protein KZZ52_42905 [Dactylosporangium sp. AC04546]